jgi:Flp pilus assembly protein TadD
LNNSEFGSTSPLDEQLAEAAKLAEDGEPDAAFELLLELEQRNPEDSTLLCMLGVMAGEADASGMSYDYFRRCLATQPEDPHVLATLGAGLARYDDPDAEGVLRLAAVTAPTLALARFRYGAYLAREGMIDLATTELTAAQELEPENPDIKRELGIARLLAGADASAVEALEDAAGLAPDDVDVRMLHGLALLRCGGLSTAAEELHAASLAATDDTDVQLLAALACASQEWRDEAWEALARAEGASTPAESALLREVEEAIDAGAEASEDFLVNQLAPALLRERLFERS